MSVIVGRLAKRPAIAPFQKLAHQPIFSQAPIARHFSKGVADIVVYDYGAAQDFAVLQETSEVTVLAQGALTQHVRSWLPQLLDARHAPSDPISNPESVAGVLLRDDEISLFTSCSGTDGFLVYETNDFLVFSNHLPCLFPFLDENAALDPIPLAWTLAKYHSFEFDHHISGVKRTEPGSKYILSTNGALKVPMQKNWDALTQPLANDSLPELVDSVADDLSEYILGTNCAKTLSLSGGKDSRAILGLLGDGIYGKWVTFATGGEVFAPDVMAAKDLTQLAGLDRSHYITKPSLIARPGDLAPGIAIDVMTDMSLSSLADIRATAPKTSLTLGGHEYGTKGSEQELTLDRLLARESEQLSGNPFLSHDGARTLAARYLPDMEEKLAPVPPGKMEVAFKIEYRLPLLLGGTLTNNNAVATEVHPFLDYRMLRLVLGSESEFTANQALHYLLNRRMSQPIENAPFANDSWPSTLQPYLLREFGIDWRGYQASPYRFNPAFPSQGSFGRYNWRIELFKNMRPRVIEFLHDGAFDRDLINVDAMVDLVSSNEDSWSFLNLYQLGSVLKFCLMNEIGVKGLENSDKGAIEHTVRDFIGASSPASFAPSAEKEKQALSEALEKSQNSIAQLAGQIREAEDWRSPRVSAAVCLKLLESGEVDLSLLNELVPAFKKLGGLKPLPDNNERVKLRVTTDGDGNVRITGYLAKDPATTVLVGCDGDAEHPIDGLVWSPAGFYYRYVVPDPETGAFEIVASASSIHTDNWFIQRWYTAGSAYLAVLEQD